MTLPPCSNGGADHSSRVLAIGAAGFIGQFIAEATLNSGCRLLTRKILKENKIDIVISAVGGANILDQLVLIRAIQTVGTIKADIGKFTIKAADDIRALKKSLHFRPSSNHLNINELACLWEKKIGGNLPRITVSEDHLLDAAKEKIIPQSVVASFTHDILFKGCQTNYAIDGADEVEATNLYPEETFTTMDEWFNGFIIQMNSKKIDEEMGNPNPVWSISAMCS